MSAKYIDCFLNRAPVCPYCGHEERDYSELPGEGTHEWECGACERTYDLEVVVTVAYTTKVKGAK